MAEKAEKKPDAAAKKDAAAAPAAAADHGKGGGGGLLTKTPVLIGGAMIIEAIILIGGYKVVAGGPKNANAADLTTVDPTTHRSGADGDVDDVGGDTSAELPLLDARFPNKQSGHTFLYDVEIYVSVKQDVADKVKRIIGEHDALIKDRVRTIIAQLDPDKLGGGSEPGLETMRRQVKYQLEEIVGEGLVDDVLVPRCIPFRADY